MVLRKPPTAHITSCDPPPVDAMSSAGATDNAYPHHYSAQSSTSSIDEPLPGYNDPSHNFAPGGPSPNRTKEPPPPEATSDLEANNTRVPHDSLDTTQASRQLTAPRPTRRARVCAGIWVAVIVLAAVLFLAAVFWPRHTPEEKETVPVVVTDEESAVSGGQGVVFRRDVDVVEEDLVDQVMPQGASEW